MPNLYIIKPSLKLLNDLPEPWGLFFQDNATPQTEGLEELHNNIMYYLAIILFAISWIIIYIVINFRNKKISNNNIDNYTLERLVLTISPALILILIAFPTFKLLYLIDEFMVPDLIIYGESNEWYWEYKYPNNTETEKYKSMDYCLMDITNIINITPWFDTLTDMSQYVAEMKPYEGKTLQEANITLDRSGPRNRLNVITWYFQDRDGGAFFAYDAEKTPITNDFLRRALILSSETGEEKIPQDFLRKHQVSSLRNIPTR